MRIAFLLGEFPKLSQTFIVNQITGLIDRGHEVDIYALDGSSTESKMHSQVQRYKLLDRTFCAPRTPQNYVVRFFRAIGLLLRHGYKDPLLLMQSLNFVRYGKSVLSLRLLYATIPFLGGRSYDIIHCQFGVYGLQGIMLRRIRAVSGSLICSFRGFDVSEYPRRCGERVYEPLFETRDSFFLANCEFFRKRVIELGCPEEKIIVHGSGIDCGKFTWIGRQYPSDGKVRVITVGRLVEKKGIEYGIRAIARSIASGHPIEYTIVGDGELRSNLENLAQELGIEASVKFAGWRSQEEIVSALNRAHIFIAPCVTSHNGDRDAPVNTLKEAMAMGLPVISTWHGGIPELVQDGISGYLVPERDADAITEKLNYLIERPELWEPLGKAGRAYVEAKYDTDKLNDELVRIYSKMSGIKDVDVEKN